MSDLKYLLEKSVELIRLRKQVKELQAENARLRASQYRLVEFDLSADSLPAFLKPQIGPMS